jgi:hypothetical protein
LDSARSSDPAVLTKAVEAPEIGCTDGQLGTAPKAGLQSLGNRVYWVAVEGIEVIETEWGSELHQRLVAEEHAARVAWRDSPEAWEQAKRMQEAGPLKIDWSSALRRKPVSKKVPIYRWNELSL